MTEAQICIFLSLKPPFEWSMRNVLIYQILLIHIFQPYTIHKSDIHVYIMFLKQVFQVFPMAQYIIILCLH